MTTAQFDSPAASSRRGNNVVRMAVIILVVLLCFALLWLVISALSGDRTEDIHAEYGMRKGFFGGDSVNGTSVLADMFEQRGHKVITWRKLSPKLDKVDTIVWFPDSIKPPTEKQREWLEKWLSEKYDRTLIYVGRDYDAEIVYWESVLPNAPKGEKPKIQTRLDLAKKSLDQLRKSLPDDKDAEWFVVRSNAKRRKVNQLDGRWKWEKNIDAKKTWIELQGYFDEPTSGHYESEVLLSSEGDPLVMKVEDPYSYDWGSGKIIVVSNGSFLLNLPLVNHEHRKLAALLIDQCPQDTTVAFVESGTNSPLRIYDSDFNTQSQAWYAMLTVWPLNAVVLHIAATGIVFCFAVFPIFGRPHTIVRDDASDFGKHIDALGKLLAKTQDREYARARLAYYEEKVKRESGASHGD